MGSASAAAPSLPSRVSTASQEEPPRPIATPTQRRSNHHATLISQGQQPE